MSNTEIIVAAMLVSGLAGGYTNFLIDRAEDSKRPTEDALAAFSENSLPYLFGGVVAAFMVPLFLNLIQNTLLSEAFRSDPSISPDKLLVLIGFCLAASFSSRAFMREVSARLMSIKFRTLERHVDAAARQTDETDKNLITCWKLLPMVTPHREPTLPKISQAHPPPGKQ